MAKLEETFTREIPIDTRTLSAHYEWIGAEKIRDALATKSLGFVGETLALYRAEAICANLREAISVSALMAVIASGCKPAHVKSVESDVNDMIIRLELWK